MENKSEWCSNWAYSCEPGEKSEYGEQMLGGELVRPAWSGHPGNVPISNGKYCWRPDFHKRPIPPFLSALQTYWGMRGGPTRGGGYWKLYGIWRAVVRVGWRKVVWAGSQGWVYVYCSTTQREAFLHSPPGIVATATLDQFAHSLTNWWLCCCQTPVALEFVLCTRTLPQTRPHTLCQMPIKVTKMKGLVKTSENSS